MEYKLIKSDLKYVGRLIKLKSDQIQYSNGPYGIREVVLHPGGAAVVAINENKKVILIEQYRYPLDRRLFELPAGKLEKNEEPETCAVRELQEETGFTCGSIEKIAEICSTPGFCNEMLHIYLAKDLLLGEVDREDGERDMKVHEFSFAELEKMIMNGDIIDAKTICGIFMAKKKLKA